MTNCHRICRDQERCIVARPTQDPEAYWLSIGRNVTYWRCSDDQQTCPCDFSRSAPMSDEDWEAFIDATYDAALEHPHAEAIATVRGRSDSGEWDPEETYLVLVSLPADAVDRLRTRLARLARKYGQDAIGMVGGSGPTLVGER